MRGLGNIWAYLGTRHVPCLPASACLVPYMWRPRLPPRERQLRSCCPYSQPCTLELSVHVCIPWQWPPGPVRAHMHPLAQSLLHPHAQACAASASPCVQSVCLPDGAGRLVLLSTSHALYALRAPSPGAPLEALPDALHPSAPHINTQADTAASTVSGAGRAPVFTRLTFRYATGAPNAACLSCGRCWAR